MFRKIASIMALFKTFSGSVHIVHSLAEFSLMCGLSETLLC